MAKRKYFKGTDKKTFVVRTDRTPRPVYKQTSLWGSKDTGLKQFKNGEIRKPKKSWW